MTETTRLFTDAAATTANGLLATLRGETFGIGASEGTRGADIAALVMLSLFAILFTLIIVVARGFAKRAAHPAPEQVLLDEVGGRRGAAAGDHRARTPAADGQAAGDRAPGAPWEKPDDWWRRMPQ